jgi:hypothetical protein
MPKRRFLVMREDGLHVGQKTAALHSSMFPVLVTVDVPSFGVEIDLDFIVKEAFKQRGWQNYMSNYSYLVFPADTVKRVEFVPRPQYDVKVSDF